MDVETTEKDLKNFLIAKTANLNINPLELFNLTTPDDQNHTLRCIQKAYFLEEQSKLYRKWFLKALRAVTVSELDAFVNNFGDEIGPEFKIEWTILRTK